MEPKYGGPAGLLRATSIKSNLSHVRITLNAHITIDQTQNHIITLAQRIQPRSNIHLSIYSVSNPNFSQILTPHRPVIEKPRSRTFVPYSTAFTLRAMARIPSFTQTKCSGDRHHGRSGDCGCGLRCAQQRLLGSTTRGMFGHTIRSKSSRPGFVVELQIPEEALESQALRNSVSNLPELDNSHDSHDSAPVWLPVMTVTVVTRS